MRVFFERLPLQLHLPLSYGPYLMAHQDALFVKRFKSQIRAPGINCLDDGSMEVP
jgi:hypothetical protein